MLTNENTDIFIGETHLDSVFDASLDWNDKRTATLYIDASLAQGARKHFDLVKIGVTIDVLVFECDHAPRIRENGKLLFSIVDVYEIEKSIQGIVAKNPYDKEMLSMNAFVTGTLVFGEMAT